MQSCEPSILNSPHSISQYAGTRRDPTDPLSGAILGVYDTVEELLLGLVAGPIEIGRQRSPLLSFQTTQPDMPHAAAQVTLETGKGLGRIVTATLKSPAIIMHDITRGFHNLPKSYGEQVRTYENVTGLRSGFAVSVKVRTGSSF